MLTMMTRAYILCYSQIYQRVSTCTGLVVCHILPEVLLLTEVEGFTCITTHHLNCSVVWLTMTSVGLAEEIETMTPTTAYTRMASKQMSR